MRGVTVATGLTMHHNRISTHTPHARRDAKSARESVVWFISTHTPHARRDYLSSESDTYCVRFQLTRLMRGVTALVFTELFGTCISTHTPHARRDFSAFKVLERTAPISTHTPHARRDLYPLPLCTYYSIFQLTRLMRGVTMVVDMPTIYVGDFKSHASCEA